jgi:hypothetical protein
LREIKYHYFLFAFLSVVLLSCDNSTTPLKDGFTVYGTVIDLNSGEKVDSVKISLGFQISDDSLHFMKLEVITDKSGEFVYKGGIGTAPSDEILRFEHHNYNPKNVVLSEKAVGADSRYSLVVELQPK